MTDVPDDKTIPDEPLRPTPDGWAAWSKKAGDPLEPMDGSTAEPADGTEPAGS